MQDIAGTLHLHGMKKIPVRVFARVDDRRQVNDNIHLLLPEKLPKFWGSDICCNVLYSGNPPVLGYLPDVCRDDPVHSASVIGKGSNRQAADVAASTGDEHILIHGMGPFYFPFGSWCMFLKWIRPGAIMCLTGSTSTWMTEHLSDFRQRSRAGLS